MSDTSKPIELHPAPINPEVRFHEGIGEEVANTGFIVAMIRDGETPQARELYRLYLAEHRARLALPLTDEKRQQEAMLAAMKRFGLNLVEFKQ